MKRNRLNLKTFEARGTRVLRTPMLRKLPLRRGAMPLDSRAGRWLATVRPLRGGGDGRELAVGLARGHHRAVRVGLEKFEDLRRGSR